VQNHAQQAAVDRQAIGVVDKAKLLEFHHEMADPRSRRADHLRQMLLINSWEDGLGSAVLSKMRKQQKDSRQAFLAGIEKLVHEIRFKPDISGKQMCNEQFRDVMLLVEHASHYRPLDPDQSAVGHRGGRGDAQRLPRKAAFTQKVAGTEYGDNRFLTLLGYNRQLDLAFSYVEDGIRRLTLRKYFTLRAVFHSGVAAFDSCEDSFPIYRQDFLLLQCNLPTECTVACRTHTKVEAVITIGFAPGVSAIASCNKMLAPYVQFGTL
jgi:hypothetical protein